MTRHLILYVLCCGSLLAEPLELSKDRAYNAVRHLWVLETSRETPFALARKKEFTPHSADAFGRYDFKNANWIRCTLINRGPERNWYFSLSNNRLDYVEFHFKDGNGRHHKQVAGDHLPFRQWSQPYSHPVFRIFMRKDETRTVYLRVRSSSRHNFMVEVYGPMALARTKLAQGLLHGFNFFVTLIYVALILVLVGRTGNRNLLTLIPFSLLYYLYTFTASGNSYAMWPDFPWLQDRLTSFTVTGTMLFLLLFIDGYLELKQRMKAMHVVFMGTIAVGFPAFYQLYEITPISRTWMVLHVALALAVILIGTLIARWRNYKDMRYILYFFSFFILGGAARVLFYFQILDPFRWNYNWPAILYLAGIFILLKASVSQYRSVEKTKEQLEERYRALLEKLQPSTTRSRILSLDKNQILSKISDLIGSDEIFEQGAFSLGKMAKNLKIRPDQLSEIINSEMNMTFSSFVNTIKIRRACNLMADSPGMTITEVFHRSGFNSKAPFNTAFRKIIGTSPTEYRRRLQA